MKKKYREATVTLGGGTTTVIMGENGTINLANVRAKLESRKEVEKAARKGLRANKN